MNRLYVGPRPRGYWRLPERAFNPKQPRDPGGEGGGQWTKGPGGGSSQGATRPTHAEAEDAFRVAPLARKDVANALALIDRTHKIPSDLGDRPGIGGKLPLKSNPLTPGVAGEYRHSRSGPEAITVDPSEDEPARMDGVVIHEIGHFLDHVALDQRPLDYGDEQSFASQDDPDLADWRRAVDASATVARLDALTDPDQRETAAYLLSREELFARSYSQWVATRSGDQAVLDSLLAHSLGAGPVHWDADDFAPIAAELDKVFTKKGLLS